MVESWKKDGIETAALTDTVTVTFAAYPDVAVHVFEAHVHVGVGPQ